MLARQTVHEAPGGMPKKKTWKEPELPWSMQDELGERQERGRQKRGPTPAASRKQRRKEARQQKKAMRRPTLPQPEPEPPAPEPPQKEKKRAAAAPAPAPPAKKKKREHTPTAFEEMLRERGVLRTDGRSGASVEAIDEHIDDLERKLGIKKGAKAKQAKQRLERELADDGRRNRSQRGSCLGLRAAPL